jgi:hypothetical protein
MNDVSHELVELEEPGTPNRKTQDVRIGSFTMLSADNADGPSPLSPDSLSSMSAHRSKDWQPHKFKRRASRACFCCRARKVRCNVTECGVPCYNCQRDDVACTVSKHRGAPQAPKQKNRRKKHFNGKYGQDKVLKPSLSAPTTSFDGENYGEYFNPELLSQKEELCKEQEVLSSEEYLEKGLQLGIKIMARFLDQFSTSLTKITTAQRHQSRSQDSDIHNSRAYSGADHSLNWWDEEIDWMGSPGIHQDLDIDFSESSIPLSEDQAEYLSPTPSDYRAPSSEYKRQKPYGITEIPANPENCCAISPLIARAAEAALCEAETNACEARLSNSAFSNIGSKEAMAISLPLDMDIPQSLQINFL